MENSNSRRKPKQARSQERFDKILDTAANLFAKKGFEATTTNEIAKEAAISIGSVYQYFDDKKGIAEALTARYVEALREVTDAVMVTDVADLPEELRETIARCGEDIGVPAFEHFCIPR